MFADFILVPFWLWLFEVSVTSQTAGSTQPRGRLVGRAFAHGAKVFEPGKNGLFTSCADDAEAGRPLNKIEQRGDGLDIIPQTQLGIIVSVDLEDFGTVPTPSRSFPQSHVEDLARPAPRRQERYQHWLFGLQNLGPEIVLPEMHLGCAALARVHLFRFV